MRLMNVSDREQRQGSLASLEPRLTAETEPENGQRLEDTRPAGLFKPPRLPQWHSHSSVQFGRLCTAAKSA